MSICIGVDPGHETRANNINFAITSRADYRVRISHYPSIEVLSGQIIKNKILGESESYLKEQLASLVIDNVVGKHYGREPKWLWVDPIKDDEKVLHCDNEPPQKFLAEKVR